MSKKEEKQPQQEPQAQEDQKPSKNKLLQGLVALFTIYRLRDHRGEKE